MSELDVDIAAMVNYSVALPDGVINCSVLNQLLHILVNDIRSMEANFEIGSTDGELGSRWNEMYDTLQDHSDLLEVIETQMTSLEERLVKCCEDDRTKQTSEEMGRKIYENEERLKEQERTLVESLAIVDEQLKMGQAASEDKLKLLEEQLASLRSVSEESSAKSARDWEELKQVINPERMTEMQKAHELISTQSEELEALKTQLREMIEQRDGLNGMVKGLVDENVEMKKLFKNISEENERTNTVIEKLVVITGLANGGLGKSDSAATTYHRPLQDDDAASCTKRKPRKVIRKVSTGEGTTRLLTKRTAGGLHTVVKPPERVHRSVSQDVCACSTSSSNQREEKR